MLNKQRAKMFHDLVKRIRAFAKCLEVELRMFSLDGNHDATAYLAFFDRVFCNLEEALTCLDDVVEKECHDLLAVATERIFANLVSFKPHFYLGTLTEPVDPRLTALVRDNVNSYIQRFKRVAEDHTQGPEDEDDSSEGVEGDADTHVA